MAASAPELNAEMKQRPEHMDGIFARKIFLFFRVDMEIWTHTSQYVLKGRYMHLSFYSYADVNMYEFEGGFALRIST